MGDDGAALRQQRKLRVAQPDGVRKDRLLVQHAQIRQLLGLAAPRPLPHERSLCPPLGQMGVIEQAALARKSLERLHQLRRAGGASLRHGRRTQQSLAVPAVIEQLRLPQAVIHGGDPCDLVFGNIRCADAEGRADPGVLIGLHDRVDVREIGHFVDCRHAAAQALQTAQQHAPVPFLVRQRPLHGEHFFQPLRDVQVVERPLRQALHHVRVQISHAGQHQAAAPVHARAVGREARRDVCKAPAVDQNVGRGGRQRRKIGQEHVSDQQHVSASAAAQNSAARSNVSAASPVA